MNFVLIINNKEIYPWRCSCINDVIRITYQFCGFRCSSKSEYFEEILEKSITSKNKVQLLLNIFSIPTYPHTNPRKTYPFWHGGEFQEVTQQILELHGRL